MTDKIKEIAEKWRTVMMISIEGCLYNFTMFQNLDQQHRDAIVSAVSEGLYEEPIEQAIREYESHEIARLRGIIERAENVIYDTKIPDSEIFRHIRPILSEAEDV